MSSIVWVWILSFLGWELGTMRGLGQPASQLTVLQEYVVDVWHADQGLPQGTVTSITQGGDGYLWLGTFNGLVRFDGLRFRVFGTRELLGAGNGRVVQLQASHQGGVWIAFEDGELLYGDRGGFRRVSVDTQSGTGAGGTRLVREMCEDASGGLWMRTYGATLVHYANGTFSDAPASTLPPGLNLQSIAADRDGTLWVAAGNQLFVWDPAVTRFRLVESDFFSGEILGVTKARDGGVWVVSSVGEQWSVSRVEPRGQTQFMGSFPAASRALFVMAEDARRRLWLGTLGDGLIRFAADGTVSRFSTEQGLPNPFVRSFLEDVEGNLWVGMQGGGLAKLREAAFDRIRTQEGLSADQVLSLCEGDAGEIWVGTNGEGLNQVRGRQVDRWGEREGMSHGSVWSVMRDRGGTLWVGTHGGGLFRKAGDRFVRHLADQGQALGIGSIVLALFEDVRGEVWLGQPSNGMLTRLVNGKPVTLAVPNLPEQPGLDVRAFAQDPRGGLWIGTHGLGLLHYTEGRFERFTRTNGLGSDFVWALHSDAAGRLWIGTYQGGLSCYAHGHFSTVSAAEGLPSDVVCQVLEDDQGFLWLGTYGGVVRISKWELEQNHQLGARRIRMKTFTRSDGLPSIECTGGFQPSGCRMKDGRLCFGTVKGIAMLDPRMVRTNSTPPGIQIEEVLVDGLPVTESEKVSGGVGEGVGTDSGALVVKSGWRRLELRFAALSFSSPDQVRVQGRLVGLDRDWVDLGTRRSVEYLHLPPGEYQFEVMARNGDHVWGAVGSSGPIRILPSIYQSDRFRWVLGVCGLLGVVVGVRLLERRRQRIRIERIERQRMVEVERLRIAQDIHDDLGARLTEITLLSELASDDAREVPALQAEMLQISNKARDLTRSVDEIVWAVNPSNDNLESLVTYACSYAESFLRPAAIRCRFDLPSSIPKLLLPADVRHEVFLAFKEAQTNIVRHSGATEAMIRVEIREHRVVVTVTDNGHGMREGTVRQGGGNGMTNMRERLARVGGECVFTQAPGQGLSIEFRFAAYHADESSGIQGSGPSDRH